MMQRTRSQAGEQKEVKAVRGEKSLKSKFKEGFKIQPSSAGNIQLSKKEGKNQRNSTIGEETNPTQQIDKLG